MKNEELLDIVSQNDEVIGKKLKSEVYKNKQKNFRVINGFIFDGKSKIWIPQRHPNKVLFPLHLDASVGGHVKSEETYLQAFIRESKEEVNLDITKIAYREIAYLNPFKNNLSAFMKVYLITSTQSPKYNKNDFINFYWLTPYELISKLKIIPGKSDLHFLAELLKKL